MMKNLSVRTALLAVLVTFACMIVFGAGVGAGFAATLPSSFHAEIEARVFEGLGDAYSGDFVSAKNRSSGLVLRFGRTLSR